MEFVWIICSMIVGIFVWGTMIVAALVALIIAKGGVTQFKYLQMIVDYFIPINYEYEDEEAL